MEIIKTGSTYSETNFLSVDTESQYTEDCEFTDCKFSNCNFSAKSFTDCVFENCIFDNCNLNTLKIPNCKFINCTFRFCKVTGINWSVIRKELGIQVVFDNCDLSYSVFDQMNLSFSKFLNTKMTEVNFTQVVLRNTDFNNSYLDGAVIMKSDLGDADLRTAHNYLFDPKDNKCKNTRVSANEGINILQALGLLVE